MSESENTIPDYTENFVKTFTLARDLRTLRMDFPHAVGDGRAQKAKEFIEKWLAIKARRDSEDAGLK